MAFIAWPCGIEYTEEDKIVILSWSVYTLKRDDREKGMAVCIQPMRIMSRRARYRGNRTGGRSPLRIILPIVIVAAILVLGGIFALHRYAPTKEKADLSTYYNLKSKDAMYFVVDSKQTDDNGFLSDGEGYMPVDTVNDAINNGFYWDSTEKTLRYVSGDTVITVKAGADTYMQDRQQVSMKHDIIVIKDNKAYLSLSFVKKFSNIRVEYYKTPNRAVIATKWGKYEWKTSRRSTQLREKGGRQSAVVAQIDRGTRMDVLKQYDHWAKVCTEDGQIGYIMRRFIGGTDTETYKSSFKQPSHEHTTFNGSICLGWHSMSNTTANSQITSILKNDTALNVISPTWFRLSDNKGSVSSLASRNYVTSCHDQGVQVWGLVSNFENQNVSTYKVLSQTSSRDRLVNNLVSLAIQYDLDGINVDFESLSEKTGDAFLEFIRELSVKCSRNDIIVSVDNPLVVSYTEHYHPEVQADYADYIVLMAYDEHYSGSEEAGSVASLSYVKNGVNSMLKAGVPEDQLVLGVPFFTRLWKTTISSGNTKSSVTSRVYGMDTIKDALKGRDVSQKWDSDAGQYYVEYTSGKSHYECWLEDTKSLTEKLKVMKDNKLAGSAYWRLGFESSDVWPVIKKYAED